MKRVFAAILGFVLAFATPTFAFANHIDGDTGWYVAYTNAGRMEDNYTQKAWADNVSKLQPGDDITLTVEVRQENDTPADWYMSNEVLKSLEEGDAKGSAYGYTLAYEGPSNSRTLYTSESVGGTGSDKGLADATNAMDDYFYLGTLSKGQTAKVTLNVSLDGETEGNAYFDTIARLSLKFAVEPQVGEQKVENKNVTKEETVTTGGGSNQIVNRAVPATKTNLAKTGDQTTLFPLYLAIAGLGIVCLALAVRNVRNKKNDDEGGAR